jgi:hypothetical protein
MGLGEVGERVGDAMGMGEMGGAKRNARGRQVSVVRVSAGGYSPESAVAQPFAIGRRILAGTVLGARARVGLCVCAIVS